jgi:hypothetical protein
LAPITAQQATSCNIAHVKPRLHAIVRERSLENKLMVRAPHSHRNVFAQ